MLVALVPAAAASLLPPLAPFHGPSAAARCGATPLPISMLLRPPDALGIQRKLRLQLLQRRIGSSSDGEQAGPQDDEVEEEEEHEEPFDPKMQYYIELKVQDVLDERERDALAAAREAEGVEAPSDALVQPLVKHAASRRQMAGPWTPACGAPPLPGLSFHEQHRMEQRVYGSTALARAELLGLQALGQLLGYLIGATLYILRCPQGMARILALPMVGAFGQGGAVCPPAYLPLITTMCVCSSLLMLLLPALAAQAGPVAACLRSAGWVPSCDPNPNP